MNHDECVGRWTPPPRHTKIFTYKHKPRHPLPMPWVWPLLPDEGGDMKHMGDCGVVDLKDGSEAPGLWHCGLVSSPNYERILKKHPRWRIAMVSVASLFTRPVRSNILIQLSSRPSHRIRKRLPSVVCNTSPPPPPEFCCEIQLDRGGHSAIGGLPWHIQGKRWQRNATGPYGMSIICIGGYHR